MQVDNVKGEDEIVSEGVKEEDIKGKVISSQPYLLESIINNIYLQSYLCRS